MGCDHVDSIGYKPIPLLASPLKGEEQNKLALMPVKGRLGGVRSAQIRKYLSSGNDY